MRLPSSFSFSLISFLAETDHSAKSLQRLVESAIFIKISSFEDRDAEQSQVQFVMQE